MLRDKNLVPLSHQHQRALALCVRLDRALQAGKVDLEAWQSEIQQAFEQEIGLHFAAEEKDLFPAAASFSALQAVVDELLAEHIVLRELFARAAGRNLDAATLAAFVEKLAQHIRKEERQLFEGLQAEMNADQLASLGRLLEQSLKNTSLSCSLPRATSQVKPKPDHTT